MKTKTIFADRDTLAHALKRIVPETQVTCELVEHHLTLTLVSSQGVLEVELHDFKREDRDQVDSIMDIINESMFIIMEIIQCKGHIEAMIRPLLEFLDSRLISIILVPLESMNEKNESVHKELGTVYLRNFDVNHYDKMYVSYQHPAGYL